MKEKKKNQIHHKTLKKTYADNPLVKIAREFDKRISSSRFSRGVGDSIEKEFSWMIPAENAYGVIEYDSPDDI
jgi:hypothetical protein